ncbi:MAG TPA: pyridoxamine 5'-phosphate oxidase family protein [Saprospiraceae bacterium]|nr:pyridoxamine 5'-phosphate oxidase family protein [Saprospiraceae bacterium]
MITEDMKIAMQGILPSLIATCDADGIPNIAVISQTYYIDKDHVAISHQFFNKTIRNIQSNPHVCLMIIHPSEVAMWMLHATHSHAENEGELFDQMVMQLEAIASMIGMEGVFKLQAAEVFNVDSVEFR